MKRVDALPYLNVREKPKTGAVKGKLLYGEYLTEEQPAGVSGWLEIKAKSIGGSQIDGFVSTTFIRDSESDAKEKLMVNCVNEWLRFDRGNGKETVDPYFNYIGEMWKSIGIDLDGTDNVPWSAAFISFVVRNAGSKYAKFKFAAAHSKYINDSIKKRNSNTDSPFYGYRLNEQKPQLGDMVCMWRVKKIDFDYAVANRVFQSHCDIIVQVKPDKVVAIGGNVSNSVSKSTFPLNSNGFLSGKDSSGRDKVFALLKNRN